MKMGAFFVPDGGLPDVLQCFDRLGTERLNADAALKHIRIRRELVQLAQDFRERHRKLVEPHRDEAGEIPVEVRADITAQFKDLLNADAPLSETFTREELWARDRETGKREPVHLSPNDWTMLESYGIIDQLEEKQEPGSRPAPARKRAKARRAR